MKTFYTQQTEKFTLEPSARVHKNQGSKNKAGYLFKISIVYILLVTLGFTGINNVLQAQTACTGTPAPGNTVASVNPVCNGGSTTLSLQNSSSGTGIIYNWQSSTDGTNYTYIGPYIMNNATFASTPANMTVYGNAAVTSGTLQLTNTSTGGQIGGAVISTTPGSNITPFTAVFDYRIWDGTGADGFSLSYASNITNDAGTGETGEGSGIILMLDTYDNAGNVSNSQIRINYNGAQVFANSIGAFQLRNSSYQTVRLSVDGSGYLSLSIGSTSIVSNLLLTGYAAANKTNWKFKFSGRTGSLTDTHSIDGLTILMGNNSTLSQSLSVSTYFKCLVTCASSISNATSTAFQVVASPASVGGTASTSANSITTGTSTTISLIGYTGSIQWQQSVDENNWSNVSGGSGENSATYTTPELTSTTYYRAVLTSSPCSSANSSTASVTVVPAAPSATATPSAYTIGGSSNLNAVSTGNFINWYDVASGGSPLTMVQSGVNYLVSPSATKTYYAEAMTTGSLRSLTRTPVMVTVCPVAPTNVTATPDLIYTGGQVSLNASSPGNKIKWYTTSSEGSAFATVNSGTSTVVVPVSDQTYYAETYIPPSTADINLANSNTSIVKGVFFDVTPKPAAGAVTIDGFPFNANSANFGSTFSVYYRIGTYSGHETSSTGWVLQGTFSRTNNDLNGIAYINIDDLTIPANTTYGFYIYCEGLTWPPTPDFKDLNALSAAQTSSSDAFVTLSGGTKTTGDKWSSVDAGQFHGGVRYISIGEQTSLTRTPVSVAVSQTPATQATSVTFNSVQTTQMGISWTNGNGSNRAVFVIEGSSGTVSLNNGTSYPADPVYVVSGFSPNWQCVYNGTETSVTVTGLKAATIYRVHVCEYNGTEGNQAYNITSATGNPALQQTAFSEITWDGSESTDWFDPLNWTPETYPDVTTNLTIPNTSVKPLISDGSGPPMTATCNNITIQTGAVLTIGATGKLTVNGTLTNNAGAAGIVVNSGGSLIEHSGANATVKRDIAANEWHLISAPVSTAKAGMFSGFYLQKHTESTNAYTDITDIGEDLIPVQGYALYGSAGVSPAVFSGALNAGDKSFITSLSASPGQGWNLIGNPYPSSIDWNSMEIVKLGIEYATYCHVSSTEGAENEGWATYINGSGTNGGTQYIAPCQGFFVKANAETGSVTMKNGARLHNATTFFKNTKIVPNLIRLEVSGNGYKDEAVVRFVPEATADFDGNYDAHKLFGEVAAAAQIYTTGTGQLSINSLLETNMVPVGVKIGSTGSYSIAATEMNDMPYATLEDTKTGIFTELAKGPYTFNFNTGEDEMRFKLHFSALSVNDDQGTNSRIYSYQKTVYINLLNLQQADIYIYNAAGQLVTSRLSATGLQNIQLSTAGVYIVKVVSESGIQTQKIIINQ